MIAISGDGIAACCCARLVQGIAPTTLLRGEVKAKVPALMLSDSTRLLLEDAFEDRTIFDGLPRIRQRIVSWGSFREPVLLPHTGIVVSESALLERLWQKADFGASSAESSEWEIRCSGKVSAEGE